MSKEILSNQKEDVVNLFLNAAYEKLEYNQGALLAATKIPAYETPENEAWLEKGNWLSLAEEIKAEKVFFVGDDPEIVFCKLETENNLLEQLELFRKAWCMARPKRLFMALPNELRVYSLNRTPVNSQENWQKFPTLKVVKQVEQIVTELEDFHRSKIETGLYLSDDISQRADKRLIQDLKIVRRSLVNNKNYPLKLKYAHSLIGRSIFIRYLEDRGVLKPENFELVATQDKSWQTILSENLEKIDISPGSENRKYDRVLRNKEFTYALFKQLSLDFNGDMFPDDPEEEKHVHQIHLDILRKFLLGDVVSDNQEKLFFWAYDFKIIPTEVISSIYEEFYHKDNENNASEDYNSTHYTPPVLVENVLSRILTKECLATNPKILDPACGSGIFLVEAFRRIVRFKEQKSGSNLLNPEILRQILRDQITGIEINEEAARVTAFSLYLTMLNYLEPPDIWANNPLPNLIYKGTQPPNDNNQNFNIIINLDAFSLLEEERKFLQNSLLKPIFNGRVEFERLLQSSKNLPFEAGSFDIIIGNPPWGFKKGATEEIQEAQNQAGRWCKVYGWSIGDRELTQAFIARTLHFLKQNGQCGFLVSSGVLFKQHINSRNFRKRWLEETTISTVINFAHVRHSFFKADAPFAFVHYTKKVIVPGHFLQYWSAKKTAYIDKTQSIVLGYDDFRQVEQVKLLNNDYLWRVYWWGSHRDAALISGLKLDKTLEQVASVRDWPIGRGFEGDFPTGDHNPSDWLKNFKQLPIELFQRYGPLNQDNLKPVPDFVHRFGNRELYSGWRLLVKHGITQAGDADGRIETRLDDNDYCFTNSINAVRLDNAEDWERKILLGILWSSLARYFYFLTLSSWGTWHNQIYVNEVVSLPIRFPENGDLRDRIIGIVDKLQNWTPIAQSLLEPEGKPEIEIQIELRNLESNLDEAIFELYNLVESERDLVIDMCTLGLEFFYRHVKSSGVSNVESYPIKKFGSITNLAKSRNEQKGLEGYLQTFISSWNKEIEPEGELSWQVIRPINNPMIAIVFRIQEKGLKLQITGTDDEKEWNSVLKKCSETLYYPISSRIYIDRVLRVVTESEIIIIKRDEQKLWTRSMAREDAEATLTEAIHLQSLT